MDSKEPAPAAITIATIGAVPKTEIWDAEKLVQDFKATARAQFDGFIRDGGYKGWLKATANDLLIFLGHNSASVGQFNISVNETTFTVNESMAEMFDKQSSRVAQDLVQEVKSRLTAGSSGIRVERFGPCVRIKLTKFQNDDEYTKQHTLWCQHQVYWYNSDERSPKLPSNPVHTDSIFCMQCLKHGAQAMPRVICACAMQVWAVLCQADEGYNTLLPGMDLKVIEDAQDEPDALHKKISEELRRAVTSWRERCIQPAAAPGTHSGKQTQNGDSSKKSNNNNKKKKKKKKPKAKNNEDDPDTDDGAVLVN